MPYVTDEIYNTLTFKDAENIMVSSYPTYNSKLIFKEESEIVENVLSFIRKFRNIKAEANMDKSLKVKLENNNNYDLIIKMLKLEDSLIKEDLNIKSYVVEDNAYKVTIYFEKKETEEDIALKNKQIESLKQSIARRKKLLANENYVQKAPQKLVEEEKEKLKAEEKELANLEQ